MPIKPITQVLVRVDKALQDEITTDSGLKLYLDPTFKKEWACSVTATIAALPTNPKPQDKKILSQLKVGDEVAMSYQVVADFEFKGDGGQFMSMVEDNDYVKEFINGKGDTVKAYALPKRSGLPGAMWVGVYQSKKRELIDGIQGTESEVYRWLSQFPFGKTDIYTFNNLFSYNGEDYWRCFATDIFAKKVKGHWVAVNNRLICKPFDGEVPDHFLVNGNGLPEKVKIRYQDRARLMSGGKKLKLKKDAVISFDPKHCEKYEFDRKQYYLINENVVEGIWQEH